MKQFVCLLAIFGGVLGPTHAPYARAESDYVAEIKLPKPKLEGGTALQETLRQRRSLRSFSSRALSLEQASQLLWAAQGITSAAGERTAPSAGALYPLELYLVAGAIEGLPAGLYKYRPDGHELHRRASGDLRHRLAGAALRQDFIKDAPATIAITGVYERVTRKYGGRGERYTHMEVGHAGQNLYLQATALGLGTVMVGAFRDDRVSEVLRLPKAERPLALMPVGRPD